jgi:single-strand DNA-binding protein
MLKARIIGNVGQDPELRCSAEGRPVLSFSVATNSRSRSPEGEWQERTEWVRVTVVGTRAETLPQHLCMGSRVYVEGRLEARPWTDRQGRARAGLEVVASEVRFMNPRQTDDDDGSAGASVVAERRDRQPMPQATAVHGSQATGGAAVAERDHTELEDLPF